MSKVYVVLSVERDDEWGTEEIKEVHLLTTCKKTAYSYVGKEEYLGCDVWLTFRVLEKEVLSG